MSLGIDVVPIERLRALLEIPGMSKRLFTDAESQRCARKADPTRSLAGVLAAKEATIKALGLRSLPVWSRRIEVLTDGFGAPQVRVDGRSETVEVSISHDGGLAVAVATSIAMPLGSGTS